MCAENSAFRTDSHTQVCKNFASIWTRGFHAFLSITLCGDGAGLFKIGRMQPSLAKYGPVRYAKSLQKPVLGVYYLQSDWQMRQYLPFWGVTVQPCRLTVYFPCSITASANSCWYSRVQKFCKLLVGEIGTQVSKNLLNTWWKGSFSPFSTLCVAKPSHYVLLCWICKCAEISAGRSPNFCSLSF